MFAKSMASTLMTTLVLALPVGAAEIRGIIAKIDPDKKELVLEGRSRGARGLTLSFQIATDTQILFGQQRGQLSELAPGKRVHVFYELRDGHRVATLINVAGARPTSPTPNAPMPLPDGNTISGVLRRISLTEREITVISPGKSAGEEIETTFVVPADVQILKEQAQAKLEALKEGDPVHVRSEKRDGKLVARSIHVGESATVGGTPQPSRIERLRGILKILDGLLQKAEQKREGQP